MARGVNLYKQTCLGSTATPPTEKHGARSALVDGDAWRGPNTCWRHFARFPRQISRLVKFQHAAHARCRAQNPIFRLAIVSKSPLAQALQYVFSGREMATPIADQAIGKSPNQEEFRK